MNDLGMNSRHAAARTLEIGKTLEQSLALLAAHELQLLPRREARVEVGSDPFDVADRRLEPWSFRPSSASPRVLHPTLREPVAQASSAAPQIGRVEAPISG